ncbi:hypothetical protein [Psychrobacillus sp. FSL K6-1267]|uniref:hypothetical protein n=1 Tax=Psychrobacillus sp. FSL K6-1267 TaxID=2921543 RepID=UPI0030FAC8D5
MRKIISVDGWATVKESYKGNYRNEQGLGLSGFFRRDYKENHEMVVVSNGNLLCRYKYPRGINIPFESPMVRWMNLIYCGGYDVLLENGERSGSNERLLEAVNKGLKPIGFIIVNSKNIEIMVERVKLSGLHFEVSKQERDTYEIGIANRGKVKDHFDLKKLISSYQLFSEHLGYDLLTSEEEEILLKTAELELNYFIKDFAYASCEKRKWEHVLTGLLLGYPIESTVSFLSGRIY